MGGAGAEQGRGGDGGETKLHGVVSVGGLWGGRAWPLARRAQAQHAPGQLREFAHHLGWRRGPVGPVPVVRKPGRLQAACAVRRVSAKSSMPVRAGLFHQRMRS